MHRSSRTHSVYSLCRFGRESQGADLHLPQTLDCGTFIANASIVSMSAASV